MDEFIRKMLLLRHMRGDALAQEPRGFHGPCVRPVYEGALHATAWSSTRFPLRATHETFTPHSTRHGTSRAETNTMFVAERTCGDSRDPPLTRTYAQSRAELGSSRARVPYVAGCEFSPPTVLRTAALQSKSIRSLPAYSTERPAACALRNNNQR